MTLVERFPCVKNVILMADPQDGLPYAYRAVIVTDLNLRSCDLRDQMEQEPLRAECEAVLRRERPFLTGITWTTTRH